MKFIPSAEGSAELQNCGGHKDSGGRGEKKFTTKAQRTQSLEIGSGRLVVSSLCFSAFLCALGASVVNFLLCALFSPLRSYLPNSNVPPACQSGILLFSLEISRAKALFNSEN
jgi:hypothetical protein